MNDFLQSVGIDIAKDKFDVCFKERKNGRSVVKGTKTFKNDSKGFLDFHLWYLKRRKENSQLVFVMEATGIYYEELAYFLHSKNEVIYVELPQKVKYFAKSLNIKTKTDKVDAKLIADIGLERSSSLKSWNPPSEQFKAIRDLCREISQLKKNKSAASSRLHAWNTAHNTIPEVIKAAEEHLDILGQLIKKMEGLLLERVKQDEKLYEKIERIAQVKGLGVLSVTKVIAETNGFLLFNSIRQLVSYAGLDVIQEESGQYKGKSRLSKKGNAHLRAALYMPAVTAVTHNENLKEFYTRLNKKFNYKKQSLVAVMRKLLILIYTLWKSGKDYNPHHQWQEKRREVSLPPLDSY
ncbi:IS110 family transposase [Autumnicola edwardsiae]|uniref:IS110 family transposase n=1 Tax=Autumnicola edwardsiae TaxID=3075594 RepID=A0ABU3CZV4_9FLAO|nr:IS110 family transposase [Zunongwangia sp. F297]MDT0651908.1 IS110 family transposase [Zunongwangia sp. F297]